MGSRATVLVRTTHGREVVVVHRVESQLRSARPRPRHYHRRVPISPYVQSLREKVGTDLLVLPSAAVVPRDECGRVLLVRLSDTGNWAVIGGAIEPDESPEACAVREAAEEAQIDVRLGRLLGVLGGPDYRVTYPNGDRTAYVVTVFDAEIIDGSPQPDDDETTEVAWWDTEDLPFDCMGTLTRALLRDVGMNRTGGRPRLLVLVTGLQGSGKSTIATAAAALVRGPVLSFDWMMSGLRPFSSIQDAVDQMNPSDRADVGWSLLTAVARSQLRLGSSAVVDGIARAKQVEQMRALAEEEGATLLVIMADCPDADRHRARIEGRHRMIPNWYELTWDHVQRSRANWDPTLPVGLRLDTTETPQKNLSDLFSYLRPFIGA